MVTHVKTTGQVREDTHQSFDKAEMKATDVVGTLPKDVFGLINSGAKCWFNSLIQALISSDVFTRAIVDESEKSDSSEVLSAFGRFLCEIDNPRAVRDASPILAALMRATTDFGHRQEDAHEGFHLVLDRLGPKIEQLFESLWQIDLYCDLCKSIVSHAEKPEKLVQVIMERDFIPVNTAGDPFAEFLSGHMTIIEGYKCPKCATIGRAVRIARLVHPGKILVVSFNKYMEKWESPAYRTDIEIKYLKKNIGDAVSSAESKGMGSARYALKAVVKHYGSMHGGHYNAVCQRSIGAIGLDDAGIRANMIWGCDICDYMLFFVRI